MSSLKAIALAALVALPLVGRVAAQGVFEGRITGKMTTPDGKVVTFRMYQLGSRMRQEYLIEGHQTASIYDGTTGDAITLLPDQRKYMVMNLRQMGAAARRMAGAMGGGRQGEAPDFTKMKVTATGQRETIAGMECEHYLFENTENHSKIDMCGASGHGYMGVAGQSGSSMGSTIALMNAQNPELAKLARRGFLALKMTFFKDNGQPAGVWEVTEVDTHRPEAALFAPPAGYTKLEMPGLPGGRH